jgi:ketosteroid isomerase-like protein
MTSTQANPPAPGTATSPAGGPGRIDGSAIVDPGLRDFLVSFREGTQRFMNGDTALWLSNASRRDDVMIMGAWGAHEKGWPDVEARYRWAGARFRDSGAELNVEYLTAFESGDLAVTTAIERAQVKLEGQETAALMALRVTHVFRREDGAWKLVLRHADPLVAKTAPATVLEKPEGSVPPASREIES